ncbi:hypothetical protein CEXT_293091 [Caerostris extrusa]|uniref:Uncharacterized protein n=1 Tax=Caerostris extrusa TaxID=172846 RepID=A0AAV4WJY0_CAEEX|nr:hypothetical protein CEXT_293091 [Caerostris extrusa]
MPSVKPHAQADLSCTLSLLCNFTTAPLAELGLWLGTGATTSYLSPGTVTLHWCQPDSEPDLLGSGCSLTEPLIIYILKPSSSPTR